MDAHRSSGTATCSAARARTSTRGRSRASGAALGHDVTIVCQERHPEQLRPRRRARRRARSCPDGLLPVFVLDEYEGLEARLLQDFTRRERDAYVEANAAALRELLPADLVFANHVLLGGARRRARRAPATPSRRTAPSSSTRCAGDAELARWGAESLADAEAVYVGSAHIRARARGRRRPRRPRPRGAAGRRRRRVRARRTRDAGARRRCSREARRDPGDGDERQPDEGNAARFTAFFADDAPTVVYFGKLIENKGVQVLLEALRGLDARAVIVGFGDYRAELEALAPRARRSSPARSSTATSSTCCRSPTSRSCRRSSRRRSAWSPPRRPPPACRRSSRTTRASPRSPPASPPSTRPSARISSRSRRGDAAALRERLRELLALPPAERRALGLAARRAVERNWSWTRVAERLLEPLAG